MMVKTVTSPTCPEVLEWMSKKTNKYKNVEIRNECLQAVVLNIL